MTKGERLLERIERQRPQHWQRWEAAVWVAITLIEHRIPRSYFRDALLLVGLRDINTEDAWLAAQKSIIKRKWIPARFRTRPSDSALTIAAKALTIAQELKQASL